MIDRVVNQPRRGESNRIQLPEAGELGNINKLADLYQHSVDLPTSRASLPALFSFSATSGSELALEQRLGCL
jgi:hypothetical protein